MQKSRLESLATTIQASSIQGIALNAGPSLRYFTGLNFHLMERPVVFIYIPEKKPVLILPRLEAAKLEKVHGIDAFYYNENPEEWHACFTSALQHLDVSRLKLGIEPLQLRYVEFAFLKKAGVGELVDGSHEIAMLRSRKDTAEIELMRKAVEIAEGALRATLPLVRLGMDEKELASELVVQLFRQGSEPTLPFSPIVSSGPNGANPHAHPSSRKLTNGDLLVIDWGARYEGYVSDLTRTFAVGELAEETIAIHELVQRANAAGRAAGVVGAPCSSVDEAARIVIEDGGFGEFFTHRTGHGIGMQCHEEPYMHAHNDQPLQAGMTYTVEPGIYLPGRNGVRIEDDVVVQKDGPISLSSLPRRIIQVC